MIAAAVGVVYQAGVGAALQNSRLARSGLDAAERFGVVASVVVVVVVVLVASVVLSVLRSLVTYGNLVLSGATSPDVCCTSSTACCGCASTPSTCAGCAAERCGNRCWCGCSAARGWTR